MDWSLSPFPPGSVEPSLRIAQGFDLRILAVLALPLFAVSWALFNVPWMPWGYEVPTGLRAIVVWEKCFFK